MKSIKHVYLRPYCKLSNALKELRYKWHLEDTAARDVTYLLHDYRERRQEIRNRFFGDFDTKNDYRKPPVIL